VAEVIAGIAAVVRRIYRGRT